MQPAEIAHSYDAIAHQWLEPFLETNGIHQHKHALQFRPPGGLALDVGSGCSGRFIRLLETNGYQVEGLDLSPQMIALAKMTSSPRGTASGTFRWSETQPSCRSSAARSTRAEFSSGPLAAWTPPKKNGTPPWDRPSTTAPSASQRPSRPSQKPDASAAIWNTTNGPKNTSSSSHRSPDKTDTAYDP